MRSHLHAKRSWAATRAQEQEKTLQSTRTTESTHNPDHCRGPALAQDRRPGKMATKVQKIMTQ